MSYTNTAATLYSLISEVGIGRWVEVDKDTVRMDRANFTITLSRGYWFTGFEAKVKDHRFDQQFTCWFSDLRRAAEQLVAYSQDDILRIDCGREHFGFMECDWFFYDFQDDGHKITAIHSEDPVSYKVAGVRSYKRDWGWEVVLVTTGTRYKFVPVPDSNRFYLWDGVIEF